MLQFEGIRTRKSLRYFIHLCHSLNATLRGHQPGSVARSKLIRMLLLKFIRQHAPHNLAKINTGFAKPVIRKNKLFSCQYFIFNPMNTLKGVH